MKLPKPISNYIQNSNNEYFIISSFLVYILFHSFFEEIINQYFVDTIFKSLETSILNDFIFTFFVIVIIVNTVKNISNNYHSSKQRILLSSLLLLVFAYYRITSTHWEYTPFQINNSLKYIDVILLYFISNLSVSIFHKEKDYQTIPNKGFCFDNPIEKEEADKLNRNSVAKIIAEKIKNTANKNSSFAIGVNSEWGWGKTSFLNLVKNNLTAKNQLILHFNPWLNNDEKAIVSSFFDILSFRLKDYDKDLSHELIKYGKTINSISSNKGFETVNNLINIFQDSKDLKERYESINKSIKTSGLQIIIFIDDLDRLFENEVSEVLKLIRNTANFSNTVFVVAYDRNYLITALKKTNDYHPEFYLEKIFQFEIALPAFDRKNIKEKLQELLTPHLANTDKDELKKVLQKAEDPNSMFDGNSFNLDLLINLRDVNRFVNSFIISYDALKGEIVLEDLLNIELLKVKYLGVYHLIANKHDKFLEPKYIANSNYLTLKKKKDENDKELAETILEEHLHSKYKDVGIQKNQIESAINYVYNAFPTHGMYYSSVTLKLLSIANPVSINRYFHYNLLESDLSEVEFSNSRNKAEENFISDIEGWLNKGFGYEVSRKLSDINFFANREDYEKIITAIFFYSNFTPLGQENNFAFDYQNLLDKLSYKKVERFYTQDELQLFIRKLFESQKSPYLYISQFLDYIFEYGITKWKFIIPEADLIKLKIEFFKKHCAEVNSMNRDVFYLFHYCRHKEYQNDGRGSYSSSLILPDEAKEIFKTTATRLLQSFLKNIISTNVRITGDKELFSIVKSVETVWDNWDNFENFINEQEETEELIEFKNFYAKCKKVNFNYIEFKFKKIDLTGALLFHS